MGERIRTADKKPEVKSQNLKSAIQKNHRSQSRVSPVEQILLLQRTMGNHAVQRLMKSGALQARFRIGQPGDIYEQEADRVAEQVMRMPNPHVLKGAPTIGIVIQRKCLECMEKPKDEEEKLLQTTEVFGHTPKVAHDLEDRVNALQGGKPLPESIRAFYEPRFGYDFSQVRVHSDARATEEARMIGAKAYTIGPHVVFAEGAYAPHSENGRKLLAHELTHVVQQFKSSPGEQSKQEIRHSLELKTTGSQTNSLAVKKKTPDRQVQCQWEYIKDVWKHGKKWLGHEKKEAKEEGDWAEGAEETALHTREVLDAAKFIGEKVSKSMKDDPEAAEKVAHLAEGFEKASEYVETGEKGFKKIKKGLEIKDEIEELWNAVQELNEISDLRDKPEKSARAFDNLFVATGKLAKRLPDGPWQAYFDLLTHFSEHGGFFLNMTRALGAHARAAERVAEGKEPYLPEKAPEKVAPSPRTLEDVGRDVEAKVNRARPYSEKYAKETYERFKPAFDRLVALDKKTRKKWYQWGQKKDETLSKDIQDAATEVYEILRSLHITLTMWGDTSESLIEDMDVIKSYMPAD